MNKGFRGVLITSVIILFIGLGLIVSGVVAGATWYDVRDVIFSGKYSISDGAILGIGMESEMASGDKLEDESNILEEIDVKDIEKLTISMEAGDLDIKEGKSAYFQVNNKSNRGDCYVEYEGSELAFTIQGKRNNSRGAKTTLWIPQGLSIDDVDIHVDAGNVDSEDLSANNLTITVGAGQVKVADIKATNLEIEVDAGEFKGNGKIAAEEVILNVAAGNLKVDLLESKHTNASVDVGHINIGFTGKQSDYNIDAECDIGEVKIGNEKYHMGKKYQSQESQTDKVINIECSVGQATIDFEK